ncbi:translation initiation factor IF-3 [Sneathiella sp. HT1-7]|uniref:translation initiation factor IF-3 n=1 Tax=Sneathiella sp. HT1-7 TaxID=2887192 RepID=UPI001D13A538|nr:translation initiation factor IF-3 [Sneathiella sp. HT1-7]MCC3304193.1 translation initiation factor IF-3 [Sneathiella sp. HT1-7]
MARPQRNTVPTKDGPRTNEDINVANVRLINDEGDNIGLVSIQAAMGLADEAGLDLVEVSPGETPVCKLMDFGRARFEAQKKAAKARKKQKTFEIKEIKMRPNIDQHDYDVKMRAVNKFLETGDKVKVTMRFRGREMAHQELGMKLLHKVRDETEELAKVEQHPKMEGRQMTMVIAPTK